MTELVRWPPRVELLIDGMWTEMAEDSEGDNRPSRQTVPVVAGRADESAQGQPSSCTVTLKNNNGRLTPRNPTSDWYPWIRRGTQLRYSVRAGYPHLTLTGAATSKASTPDDSSLDITTDWFIGVEIEPPAPTGETVLIGKYSTVSNNRSLLFTLFNDELLHSLIVTWSPDGTSANERFLSSLGDPASHLLIPLWGRRAYGLTFDADNGASGVTAKFHQAHTLDEILADPTGTTFATVTEPTATSVHSSTAPLEIGALANGPVGPAPFEGKIRRAQVRSGSSSGAIRANPDFRQQPHDSTASFLDSALRPWTLSDAVVEGWQTRFVGEIAEIAPTWEDGDVDGGHRVTVTASGMLRRLTQGAKSLSSTLYRSTMSAEHAANLKAYWPFEDLRDATVAASPLVGVAPAVAGVTFASEDSLPASSPLASISGGTAGYWLAPIPVITDTQWMVDLPLRVPTVVASPSWTTLWAMHGTGTVKTWFYECNTTTTRVRAVDGAGTTIFTDTVAATPAGDDFNFLTIWLQQNGANVDYEFWFHDLIGNGTGNSGSYAGTIGRPIDVGYLGTPEADGMSWGHVAVTTGLPVGWRSNPVPGASNAYITETTADRVVRLCAEEGEAVTVYGDPADTTLMGPQRPDTFVNLLQECADAELGILAEQRHRNALAFRTRSSMYNQPPIFDVTHLSRGLVNPFDPRLDDQRLRNDVTATRVNGSSHRVIDQDSIDAEGRYEESLPAVNLHDDTAVPDFAGWELHRGTWSELRYPSFGVKQGDLQLVDDYLQAGLGDVARVSGLPTHHPPGPVDQIIERQADDIGSMRWDATITGSPAGIWTVGVVEDEVLGRVDTDGSELHTTVDTDDTSFDVAVTEGPMWTTDDTQFPFEATLGGQVVDVTDIAASLVTFGSTGTASHAVNASVTPGLPASTVAGNLLLCLAAIRNSGTGVPTTPTGFVRLPVFNTTDNVQLFARVADGTGTDTPTISFTGGVANADTTAQMCRLAGLWHDAANILSGASARSQLNGSAQDIAYPELVVGEPNCIVIYLGWKQDDWTSVATIAGATEIGEPDTTTGDDQGLVWGYVIQTTAALIPAGSFVVTGGAAAISLGGVIALRCDRQVWTVTRPTDVVKGHAAGAAISLTHPLVVAL